MAGPNLELFKFGLYLFFPLAVMVHYGDPEWYHRHVLPIRDQFWPKEESLYRPPRNSEDVKSALEEMKAKRLAKRQARIEQEQQQHQAPSSQSPLSAHFESQAQAAQHQHQQQSDLSSTSSSSSSSGIVSRLPQSSFGSTDSKRLV
ncbi:hypothetical protein BCV70DRAFT_198193 [Testicularia cyperi]|uniref:Uncharacterized protein n=1 Tax=Testicularia cyperi TaxID=1882483 RepID=A0A317XVJ8_9BASI|nr:hypothetical protein BCV70DRAFT_198193 [Testicularia cyperi]